MTPEHGDDRSEDGENAGRSEETDEVDPGRAVGDALQKPEYRRDARGRDEISREEPEDVERFPANFGKECERGEEDWDRGYHA